MKRKDLCTFILLYLAVVYVYGSLPRPLAQENMILSGGSALDFILSHVGESAHAHYVHRIRGVSTRSMAATV